MPLASLFRHPLQFVSLVRGCIRYRTGSPYSDSDWWNAEFMYVSSPLKNCEKMHQKNIPHFHIFLVSNFYSVVFSRFSQLIRMHKIHLCFKTYIQIVR
jgi:hypothetical protein